MHDANARAQPNASNMARGVAAPLAVIVAIVAALGCASYYAFSTERAGEPSFWLLAGGPTIAVALLAMIRARRDGTIAAWLRPRGGDFTVGFFGAALLFGCAYAFARGVMPAGSPREFWLARTYLQLGDPNLLRAHPVLLFAGLLSVAAAEEIVWRGMVTSLFARVLEPRIAARWAWVAGALAYAASMLPTMWALRAPSGLNPLLPIAGLGAGLVWGAMARRTGRLVPGIVAHALFDWCVVVMFRLWGESL